jgi:hypothetical protein
MRYSICSVINNLQLVTFLLGEELQGFEVQDMRRCNVNGYILLHFAKIAVQDLLSRAQCGARVGIIKQALERLDCFRRQRAKVTHHARKARL